MTTKLIRTEKTCQQCGRQFFPTTSGKPARFCGAACRQAAFRALYRVSGGNTITCDYCAKIVARPLSNINHAVKNHFCSHACKGKWMSENLHGPAHPRWRADTQLLTWIINRLKSSPHWRVWREQVFAAADGQCERCNNPAEEAHHKREVTEILRLLFDPANGEALCSSCHHAHHGAPLM